MVNVQAIEARNDAERRELRDRFAMAALTGLCFGRQDNVDAFAREAYLVADAMLRAREGK
jgi:hypothetical protein